MSKLVYDFNISEYDAGGGAAASPAPAPSRML